MKKLLFACLLLLSVVATRAQGLIPDQGMFVNLNVYVRIDVKNLGNHYPKSPVQPPVVYLDVHTLYICSEHSGFTLVLKDTDETEVFSTNIPENTYTVVLPSTLSGDYTIELWDDTYVFSGDIEL